MGRFLILLSSLFVSCSPVFAQTCRLVFEKAEVDVTLPVAHNQGPLGERTPEGKIYSLKQENMAAQILTEFGFRVRQNPHRHENPELLEAYFRMQVIEGLNPLKTPDYLINGKIFDHYAPEVTKPYQIVNGLMKKANVGQTHRILVDLTNNLGYQEQLFQMRHLIYSLRKKAKDHLWEVIVLHGTWQAPKLTTIWPEQIEHSPTDTPD